MKWLWQILNSLGIYFTPDNHVTPVRRFGLYHRANKPGFSWIIPFFEQTLPPIKTSLYISNLTFYEVFSEDNIPFQVSLTVLFTFDPTIAIKLVVAQLVPGGDSLLQVIVNDYTNQGLRRLVAKYKAEDLSSVSVISTIKRNLTRLLIVQMQPFGISPLKNDGLLIKELILPDEFRRAILNARRLE